MHVCIIFLNIGGYHRARLNAAEESCRRLGWTLSAIQIAASTGEHPWGKVDLPDYVTTLLPYLGRDESDLSDTLPLVRELDRLNPDAVAIPGWGFDYCRAALQWARRRRRIRVLMSESKQDDAKRLWYREASKRLFYTRHFDAAVVGGKKHHEYLTKLRFPDNRIFHGYDVVDNEYFIERTDEIRSAGSGNITPSTIPSRPYFLSASRFIPRKNLRFLVDAFSHYVAVAPNAPWDLVLLGDGVEHGELTSAAVALGVAKRVHFPGFITYDKLPFWHAHASAFVHPARSEQWGLVVNEAMAAGLPILLSRSCGCFPDLLEEGLNGYSFDPVSRFELLQGMLRLSSNGAKLEELGMHSRQLISKFAPSAFGDALVKAVLGSTRAVSAR